MTDLLSPLLNRRAAADEDARPPALALGAAAAGLAAPGIALLLLWAVGLVGWYAADGGTHGTTRDVLRVAADTWLLGHGAHLTLRDTVVTASPLGLALGCAWLTFRLGRWAGRTCAVDDLRTAGLGTVVLGGVYGVVSLLVAVLASDPAVQPGLGLALLGGAAVGALAGGAGVVHGAGLAGELRRAVPVPVLSAAYAAVVATVLLIALGAVLTAVGLGFGFGAATGVAEELRLDAAGGVFSLLLVLGVLPNAALLGAAYLLGPGFAFGTETVVSPAEVTIAELPSVPLLAAIPPDGWAPGWTGAFLAVPFVVGLAAAYVAGRVLPVRSYTAGGARGLAGGVAAALLLTWVVSLAGGAIGSGRMADLGAATWPVLVAALTAFVPSGLVGGLLATWRAGRLDLADAEHPERPEEADPASDADPDTELTAPVPRPRAAAPTPTLEADDLSTEDTVQVVLPPRGPGAAD